MAQSKAEKALAAYDALEPTVTAQHLAQVADDLAEALRAFLPTYTVVEVLEGKRTEVAQDGFPTKAAAQNWIAAMDPAARRVFEIIPVQGAGA